MTDVSVALMRWQARRYLTRLRSEIADAGLRAAGAIPGLAAVLDQHAAAVRDRVVAGLDGSAAARPVMLASYASGVLDSARRAGWTGPGSRVSATDWTSLRLMAVCALAERDEVRLQDLPPFEGQARHAA